MKQSKGSKHVKTLILSNLTGIRDVSLGHKATADRPDRNYAKSAYPRRHSEDSGFYADVAARNKRWGL